ncbi:MAG TPA: hypothetical protein VHQ22_02125 [Terriglobales bacterium]|jgi:hypothetical protein|nr:hypothetical protein [Terriglobales bacterium]
MNEQQRVTLELLNTMTVPELELIVPRGRLPETLETEICSGDTVKLLVAGQRGMGKTTELRRLAELLRNKGSHFPIFVAFGSQESITETALIMSMANALYAQKDLKLSESAMADIREWESSLEVGDSLEEIRQGEANLGGAIPLLSAKAGVSRRRAQSTTKRRVVPRSKSDLVKYFNDLVAKASAKSKKKLAFIIDDIDKVQNPSSIEGTFIHAAQLISGIECPCVFTVPITYATSTYLRIATLPYNALYRMPAVSLFGSDGQQNDEAFSFMRTVFARRMKFNPLSPEQLDKVLAYSGGVLVEAMRMLRGICKQAILDKTSKSSDDVIHQHFQVLVDDYKYVFDTPDLWNKLAQFCNADGTDIYMTEESVPDLLYKMIIIEYRDERMWFNLHPAARELYRQNKTAIDKRIG